MSQLRAEKLIKAKVCWVAESVVTDQDTGQVSTFGIMEEVQPQDYPLPIQKLAFFCLWEREATDPQKCRAEFSITLNGQELARQSVDIDFQHYLRDRTTIRLNGFVISVPGNIAFRLAIPGHDIAE